MNLVSEITNIPTGKKFVVSTIDALFAGNPVWQTAVFKKRIGPISAWFKPILLYGEVEESRGRILHERMKAIVETIRPEDWDSVKKALVAEALENSAVETVAEREDFMSELLRGLGHDTSKNFPQDD